MFNLTIDTTQQLYLPKWFVQLLHTGASAMQIAQKKKINKFSYFFSPQLSDAENLEVFGKCNNFHGHGHNYTGAQYIYHIFL